KDFILSVIMVDDDIKNLKEDIKILKEIIDISYNEDQKEITLPTNGDNNTIIEWSSSDPDFISEEGTIVLPGDGDAEKELSAIITKKYGFYDGCGIITFTDGSNNTSPLNSSPVTYDEITSKLDNSNIVSYMIGIGDDAYKDIYNLKGLAVNGAYYDDFSFDYVLNDFVKKVNNVYNINYSRPVEKIFEKTFRYTFNYGM
ncbi:MAG: hypothetical protein GY756_17735, partial [bacterium]|nr:hypothetical protein [bacterium]